MGEYSPDGWCIIKNDKEYYVFGSWSGGYLGGDYWRRNSGIVEVEEGVELYYFHGNSGSCYVCNKNTEGRISAYNQGILHETLAYNKEVGIPLSVISYEDFIKEWVE